MIFYKKKEIIFHHIICIFEDEKKETPALFIKTMYTKVLLSSQKINLHLLFINPSKGISEYAMFNH